LSKVQRSFGGRARPLVSVLTPTIEGREHFLEECRQSVLYQTHSGWEHLRLLDQERNGCAATMNTLAEEARGDWLLPLADDDLLLPRCLETLLKATRDADIVYSPPMVWGVENPWWFFGEPPAIPSFALIRRDMWIQLGGYDHEWNREEDRRLWERAMAAGARFVKVNGGPTWIYRVHAGSKSFNDGKAT
jgi:glycosyltransferase involved in cell wall biosynthesis